LVASNRSTAGSDGKTEVFAFFGVAPSPDGATFFQGWPFHEALAHPEKES